MSGWLSRPSHSDSRKQQKADKHFHAWSPLLVIIFSDNTLTKLTDSFRFSPFLVVTGYPPLCDRIPAVGTRTDCRGGSVVVAC
ncbi:hypothetical protein LT85_2455 [Collimonas arenae]|uniref:Uncharacterized protein n=1 Tax=Collimonas arenae TaxID=279058 RepID=A0A0A1FA49_9BURK|nr:hypothetical protein LT85_2455 [Collimonas arenae]